MRSSDHICTLLRWMPWLVKINDYIKGHFVDSERGGEWWGDLNRDGSRASDAKGGNYNYKYDDEYNNVHDDYDYNYNYHNNNHNTYNNNHNNNFNNYKVSTVT